MVLDATSAFSRSYDLLRLVEKTDLIWLHAQVSSPWLLTWVQLMRILGGWWEEEGGH